MFIWLILFILEEDLNEHDFTKTIIKTILNHSDRVLSTIIGNDLRNEHQDKLQSFQLTIQI